MAKTVSHVHKYIRVKLGKHVVFKCAIPACSHYKRKELVEGQLSICWRCENTFVMNKASVALEKPHCFDCTKFKKKIFENLDAIKDFLGNMENAE